VTDWAFRNFGGEHLPCIMLVHDVDNLASCRVALKSGYPFRELSPAKPPYWFTDGHSARPFPGLSEGRFGACRLRAVGRQLLAQIGQFVA
jgi:hypothetical protein